MSPVSSFIGNLSLFVRAYHMIVLFAFQINFGLLSLNHSGSMISRLVPEILPCDDFCDGVVGGAGLGYSNRLMNTARVVLY